MSHFQSYIDSLNNEELASSIISTSDAVKSNVDANISNGLDITALLMGNVQSGKTGQMFGVMCKLADSGYSVFIVLTTDNVDLQRQTYNRAKNALGSFEVLSEKDEVLFNPRDLSKPIVIILKKNASVLKNWGNLLVSSGINKGLYLTVFDDEADAASLNTLVNKKRTSTINKYLDKIRQSAAGYLYFQVTATPQAIVLQTQLSGWKPTFVNYFKPGNAYLGGNFFYSNPKSYCIKYTSENELDEIKEDGDVLCPKGLSESILSFLVVCAHKKLKNESNCNFMIHPSVRVEVHQKFTSFVQEYLNLLQQSVGSNEFIEQIKSAWFDLQQTKPDLPHFEDIYEQIVEILDNTLIGVIPLNSKSFVCRDANNPDSLDLSKGYNIVVGGNTLGRGITFPHLQTVYYCRSSKTPQADTFWQHSRIFGYDREKELIRIFMPPSLHRLFVALNESNEMLIKQIETGIENIEIVCTDGIIPTRKNVIDKNNLSVVSGGVNIFSNLPVPRFTQELDNLALHYESEKYVSVEASDLVNALSYTESESTLEFDKNKHIACIMAIAQKRPSIKCRLIVRSNRNISKGTGTLLSPDDRALSDSFKEGITLILYRINGSREKGWDGNPVWVPNIRYPDSMCFYGTID